MLEIKHMKKNLLPLVIILVGLINAGALIYINYPGKGVLSPEEAGQKAINFINQSIQEDVTASLLKVEEESGVYKISLEIGEQEYQSFITKDGHYLFASGFDLKEIEKRSESQPSAEESQPQSEEFQPKEETETPATLDSFVQCLTAKGIKFYGSKFCGWCKKQKELFGDSLQYLTYIECINPQTNQWSERCREEGIRAVPTWEIGGEKSPGFKTLEKLAELSGCQLR